MHDSEARKHFLNIRDEREEPKRPLGFTAPKATTWKHLYQQPYGLPGSMIEENE